MEFAHFERLTSISIQAKQRQESHFRESSTRGGLARDSLLTTRFITQGTAWGDFEDFRKIQVLKVGGSQCCARRDADFDRKSSAQEPTNLPKIRERERGLVV